MRSWRRICPCLALRASNTCSVCAMGSSSRNFRSSIFAPVMFGKREATSEGGRAMARPEARPDIRTRPEQGWDAGSFFNRTAFLCLTFFCACGLVLVWARFGLLIAQRERRGQSGSFSICWRLNKRQGGASDDGKSAIRPKVWDVLACRPAMFAYTLRVGKVSLPV